MTNRKDTEDEDVAELPSTEMSSPYDVRSLEALFTLFDGGEFISEFMNRHAELLKKMLDHNDDNGHRGAKGSFTISVGYEMGGNCDMTMTASAEFKDPKRPASRAAAFVDHTGQLTLFSPMMRRMAGGVRDTATPHDPVTGEVRET